MIYLILIALGLLNTFAPEASWQISCGWKYTNAEPSEGALAFNRLIGITCLIIVLIGGVGGISSFIRAEVFPKKYIKNISNDNVLEIKIVNKRSGENIVLSEEEKNKFIEIAKEVKIIRGMESTGDYSNYYTCGFEREIKIDFRKRYKYSKIQQDGNTFDIMLNGTKYVFYFKSDEMKDFLESLQE